MLTLEAASALLITMLGASVLVVACMGAMIYAKVRVAPHVDCAREMAAMSLQLDEVRETLRRRGKQAGGIVRGNQKKAEAAEEQETPAGETNFERIKREHAMNTRRLG